MSKTNPFSATDLPHVVEREGLSPAFNGKLSSAIESIPQSDRYLIGLSGGLDSLALIYFCVPYLRQITTNIHAIHVHHGLSAHADEWAAFCSQVCESVGLNLSIERVSVKPEGYGIEAAARKARYRVFSEYLAEGGVLLLGHHLNDQAETLLMRFLKGLGPAALRGISQSRTLAKGMIYRPWLELRRSDLEEAVREKSHVWIEDESNQDRRFERNFLRHDILPLLEARRPSLLQDLHHAGRRSAEYVEFVEQWCRQNETLFLSVSYAKERALDLTGLKAFSVLQYKFILRYWFDWLAVEQPNDANFQRILDDLVLPESVTKAEVVWKGYCVRVFDGALFCLKAADLHDKAYAKSVQISDVLALEGAALEVPLPDGVVSVSVQSDMHDVHQDLSRVNYQYSVCCWVPKQVKVLTLRSRLPGDKISLNPDYAQTLKKIYQSHRILPWHRNHLPVLQIDQHAQSPCVELDASSIIVALLGGRVAYPFKCEASPDAQADATECESGHFLRFCYKTEHGLLNRRV